MNIVTNFAQNENLLPPEMYNPDQAQKHLRFSYSSKSIGCARKFEFHKMYPKGVRTDSFNAAVGTALHRAYQKFLITRDQDAAALELMFYYPIHIPPRDNTRSLEACYHTLQSIIQKTSLSDMEIVELSIGGKLMPAVEVPFEIFIKNFSLNGKFFDNGAPEWSVSYTGFIDTFLFSNMMQTYGMHEVKTTRRNIKDPGLLYQYNEQPLPYSLILEHLLGNKIETFDAYYIHVYIDLEAPYTQVLKFNKGPNEIADWLMGTKVWLHELQSYVINDWFPRNGNNCVTWNEKCAYFDLCHSRDKERIYNNLLRGRDPATLVDDFIPLITVELELP